MKEKILDFIGKNAFVIGVIACLLLAGLIYFSASKVSQEPQILTLEEALVQSDVFLKQAYLFIEKDPFFQDKYSKAFLKDLFIVVRKSTHTYLKWSYENGGYIVKK